MKAENRAHFDMEFHVTELRKFNPKKLLSPSP